MICLSRFSRLYNAFVAALCLCGGSVVAAQPAETALPEILGSAPDRWSFSRRQGGTDDYRIETVDNQPVLSATANCPILTRLDPITGDAEVVVRYRYALADQREIWNWLTVGIKSPDENGENVYKLSLAVPAGAETETLNWGVPPLPGQAQGGYGSYTFHILPAGRSAWPSLARARVEQDMAAVTPLGRRWLTVRYVLRPHQFQIWLDDRLLREATGPDIDPFGMVRLTLFEGVQLASVRVRPLPAEDSRFDAVRLDGYLNAVKFRGDTVRRDSLTTDGSVIVQGVPFTLPSADGRGNDHINLKPSWLRGGLVEGPHDGWEGDTARWRGALQHDSGRIQFRVRNGRYRALHLLAAFAGDADTTPLVTAQFYRANAGHPVDFATRVPAFTAASTTDSASDARGAIPLRLAGGEQGHLHLVTIPLEPEGLDAFADQDHLEFELTKEVRVHRSYPDPIYYSRHGAGLPSGVHVFAVTLERAGVDIDLQPDRYAHIWTAPEQPSYTLKLRNASAEAQDVEVELATISHDGRETTSQQHSLRLASQEEQALSLPLRLTRYGYHRVELRVRDAEGLCTRTRSLAWLHGDTRERGDWQEGRGPIFGFWDWNGGHLTMSGAPRLEVMAAAGAESKMSPFYNELLPENDLYPTADMKFALEHKMVTFFHGYQLSMGKHILGVDWDPTKPAEMQQALIAGLKKQPQLQRSEINKPELAVFFAEPVLGPISYMSLPEYYGEPPYEMTAAEQKSYQDFLAQFVTAASAIKKEWPDTRCLFPWGLPLFPVPFLRQSKEAADLMDGPALDVVLFERLPEMQLHQVTLSSQLWQLKQEWLKTGKPWPNFTAVEGPAISPAAPGALTAQQEADHTIRAFLVLAAYGTTRHLGWPTPSACGGSWGETHYGGGMCEPLPVLNPKPVYSAFATLTRQLNRMNYVGQIPTGSPTTLCLRFQHYKTGELLHVFWTVRGKRPVRVGMPTGGTLTIYDSMDNQSAVAGRDGQAEFIASPSPCFVHGLPDDAAIMLGEPDHTDSAPAADAVRLAELGDGTWRVSGERDLDYENSHPEFVRRFSAEMSIATANSGGDRGQALAVHLKKPGKERRTMPFYTTLFPAGPLALPGKPSAIGLWVRAASDWGRVVYCLRDAHGEKWLSVGKKDEWNVDDVHCWSQFCFDGWRYLRFELPGNAPYDGYREAGTSFWGPYGSASGQADAIVDLPLALEKIIVERRTHVISGTEQVPVSNDDVLLGALYAEYEKADDKTDEAIRLSRLRMQVPAAAP